MEVDIQILISVPLSGGLIKTSLECVIHTLHSDILIRLVYQLEPGITRVYCRKQVLEIE